MPRMNGIEATRRIKRMYPRTAIIGLSFHEEQDMAEAMCRAGASAYLQKEGDAETLFETIRDVCQTSVS